MLLQGRRVLTLALALAVIPIGAQTPPMREGQWELTVQMSMPNMPQPLPEMKLTQCVTKDQWKEFVSGGLPKSVMPADASCRQDEFKMAGNKATWKVSCAGERPMTIEGETIFDGDTATGTMNMKTAQGTMAMKMAGRHVGECQASK